jgi:hypothetical protein
LRVRWRYWAARRVAVVPVALVFLAIPAFFTGVGIIVVRIWAPAVGSLLLFLGWSACGATFLLGVAGVAPGLRSLASGGRRRACAWAAGTGARLVEAALLAADETDRRAATILVRRLLGYADEHYVAVIAAPRTDSVAKMYKALGFLPFLTLAPSASCCGCHDPSHHVRGSPGVTAWATAEPIRRAASGRCRALLLVWPTADYRIEPSRVHGRAVGTERLMALEITLRRPCKRSTAGTVAVSGATEPPRVRWRLPTLRG